MDTNMSSESAPLNGSPYGSPYASSPYANLPASVRKEGEGDSVTQRCARIRSRMLYVLEQLEDAGLEASPMGGSTLSSLRGYGGTPGTTGKLGMSSPAAPIADKSAIRSTQAMYLNLIVSEASANRMQSMMACWVSWQRSVRHLERDHLNQLLSQSKHSASQRNSSLSVEVQQMQQEMEREMEEMEREKAEALTRMQDDFNRKIADMEADHKRQLAKRVSSGGQIELKHKLQMAQDENERLRREHSQELRAALSECESEKEKEMEEALEAAFDRAQLEKEMAVKAALEKAQLSNGPSANSNLNPSMPVTREAVEPAKAAPPQKKKRPSKMDDDKVEDMSLKQYKQYALECGVPAREVNYALTRDAVSELLAKHQPQSAVQVDDDSNMSTDMMSTAMSSEGPVLSTAMSSDISSDPSGGGGMSALDFLSQDPSSMSALSSSMSSEPLSSAMSSAMTSEPMGPSSAMSSDMSSNMSSAMSSNMSSAMSSNMSSAMSSNMSSAMSSNMSSAMSSNMVIQDIPPFTPPDTPNRTPYGSEDEDDITPPAFVLHEVNYDQPYTPPSTFGKNSKIPLHHWYTHQGGFMGPEKQNQDTYFILPIDPGNWIFAVFDGHGKTNGKIAAHAAAHSMEEYFKKNFKKLRVDFESTFKEAFQLAHKAVEENILKARKRVVLLNGVLVEQNDDGPEAADGGTTATVCALIDNEQLIVAMVGDSSVVLGGRDKENGEEVLVEQLVDDHCPLNLKEYERAMNKPGVSGTARFIYDCSGEPDVYRKKKDGSGYEMDPKAMQIADEEEIGVKNARNERPTILLSPSDSTFTEQALGMTRSLGDFLLQKYGVVWEPEIAVFELHEVRKELDQLTLLLASDGVWDLWTFEEAFEQIVKTTKEDPMDLKKAQVFFEETRKKGGKEFGDTCDNLTAICVYLDQKCTTSQLMDARAIGTGKAKSSVKSSPKAAKGPPSNKRSSNSKALDALMNMK